MFRKRVCATTLRLLRFEEARRMQLGKSCRLGRLSGEYPNCETHSHKVRNDNESGLRRFQPNQRESITGRPGVASRRYQFSDHACRQKTGALQAVGRKDQPGSRTNDREECVGGVSQSAPWCSYSRREIVSSRQRSGENSGAPAAAAPWISWMWRIHIPMRTTMSAATETNSRHQNFLRSG